MWLGKEKLAVGAMLALSISYGVAGFTARELQQDLGTWQQVALQNWGGCLVAVMMLWLTKRRLVPARVSFRGGIELVGRGVVGRMLGSVLFIQASLYAPLGTVGWLSALPTSVLFAWMMWGERVSMQELLWLLTGVLGVGLILLPTVDASFQIGYGELCAIGSTLVAGFAMLLGRSAVRESDSLSATIWVTLTTALVSSVLACIIDGGLELPGFDKGPVLALVVMMVALNTSCGLFGYAHLPSSVATALVSLEAVWAILLGYLAYGEIPTSLGVLGGAMIVWSAYKIKPGRR